MVFVVNQSHHFHPGLFEVSPISIYWSFFTFSRKGMMIVTVPILKNNIFHILLKAKYTKSIAIGDNIENICFRIYVISGPFKM